MTKSNLLLVITATTTALMAGIFFAFSCSVGPGLGHLTDVEYVTAMQSINRSIQNPLFFVCFFGAPLSLLFSTCWAYSRPLSPRFWFLSIATIVYFSGALGATVFGNIPLNNTLDQFDILHATRESVTAHRIGFEGPWNTLNNIRSIASISAVILVAMACLKEHKITLSK